MPEHISRKELKQDKIKETFEHSAEAVFSHSQLASIVVLALLVVGLGYAGWRYYMQRQTDEANVSLDIALKAYQGRIGAPNPADPSEPVYPDENSRVKDASLKFLATANRYSGTNPGKLARYYSALCFEDLDQHNQAIEQLQKISNGSDKELAAMAQYQMAVIYARTDKTADAIKLFRALADKPSALVPRPLVLLELAGVLRKTSPQEATSIYQQLKKDFPDTPIAEQADRGLDMLSAKS